MADVPALKLERLKNWRVPDIVLSIVCDPETGRAFIGSSDFHVYELVEDEEKLERTPFEGDQHESYVTALTLAGAHLISGSYDGRLIWWDWAERRAVRAVAAHDRWIRRVTRTPDGTRIVSVADDMQCKVWDAADGSLLHSFSDHAAETPHHFPSMLYAVGASADGQWLATADKVGHVAVWDLDQGRKITALEAPEFYTWDPRQRIHSIGGIRSVAFSPDGTRLAVGGIGQIGNIDHLGGPARVEIFDWRRGERLVVVSDEKLKGLVEQIEWRGEGEDAYLVCFGGDHKGFVSLWRASDGQLITQTSTDGHVHGAACGTDRQQFELACHQRIERWAVQTG